MLKHDYEIIRGSYEIKQSRVIYIYKIVSRMYDIINHKL